MGYIKSKQQIKNVLCSRCHAEFPEAEIQDIESKHYCAKCVAKLEREQKIDKFDQEIKKTITDIMGEENNDCIIYSCKQIPKICAKYSYTKEEVARVLIYIAKYKKELIPENFDPHFGMENLIFRYYKNGLEDWYNTHELNDLLIEQLKEYETLMDKLAHKKKTEKKTSKITGDFSQILTKEIKERQENFKQQQLDKLYGPELNFDFLDNIDDFDFLDGDNNSL